ncbi:hypothetical protein ACTS9D_07125 [Empedobacter brevis]
MKNYIYVLSLLYPLILFYSLYTSILSLINIYTAIAVSSIVALVSIILVSIPSYYFIKGENLFDLKEIIEIIQIQKPKKKNYKQLDSVQLGKLNLLYNNDARNYFNCAEYNFEIFKNLINNIVKSDFESKILLNEEVKVKDFVAFIDELVKITGFDLIDLCKNYKFYINGEYIDLNYGSVKVDLWKFRKLTNK